MKKIVLLSVLSVIGSFCLAQEKNKMNLLDRLIGDYEVVSSELTEKGWIKGEPTSSSIESVFDGRFLKEQTKHKTPNMELNMLVYIGYDSRVDQYKLTVMDKEYGIMDTYYGHLSGKSLMFTNMESDVPFVYQDGSEVHFRLTYEFTDSGINLSVEGTKDKGESWFWFSKATYRRL